MINTVYRTRLGPGIRTRGDPKSEPDPTNWENEVSSVISDPCTRIKTENLSLVPVPEIPTTRTTSLRKIAFLGNHLPRRCGIATFTTDLSEAVNDEFSALECFVVAMNDAGRQYNYPVRVRVEIAAADVTSYRHAAEFLNVSLVDVVSVQHEYGIFGGKAGRHVLAMLRDLRMPIVTTLHTILAKPNLQQRLVMDELIQLSERVVVMSALGVSTLRDIHNVPETKVDLIPHGIPSLPNAQRSRIRLGIADKLVLLTFGLLSPDKGIEYVIDALPAILKRFPSTLYIVLGATHPHVKEQHGETYRVMLEERAKRLGVESNVVFYNRFVNQKQLTEFLSASDIYITPYLNPEQSTSGTLAYAVGSGKSAISTPYSYARELLSNNRGVIVPWPWDDPQGITHAIIQLLEDNDRRIAFCETGAIYYRSMLWPEVARSYVNSFERAHNEHSDRLRGVYQFKRSSEQPFELPKVNLAHLSRLSDHTGILQHAVYSVPCYEHGYCLDDNARALLLTLLLEKAGIEEMEVVHSLAYRYLAFVRHALDARTGRFINFMSYSRQWIEGVGSEDCHGRALWALGSVVGRSGDAGRRKLADVIFHAAIESIDDFTSPRAWAYALLGIDEYLNACPDERKIQAVGAQLAGRLLDLYRRACSEAWPWFEERATYCNARLSQALLVFGWRMGHDEMLAAGLRSLEWLSEVQCSPCGNGYFAPIGSNGFYERDGTKAAFDQQSVEACTMVSACLLARRVTGNKRWALDAHRAFNWFLGENQLQQSLYDPATGGCRDGLHSDRTNDNQGAEATLSFLLALLEMRLTTESDRRESTSVTKLKENMP